MHQIEARERNDAALNGHVGHIVSAIAETLSMVANRPVAAALGEELLCLDIEGWLWLLSRNNAVIRATIGEGESRPPLLLVLDVAEAVTLAAALMEAPEEVVGEHRKGDLKEWHLKPFGEVAAILCSGIDNVLRERLGPHVSVHFEEIGTIRPGFDRHSILGHGEKAVYDYSIAIGDYPASEAYLIIDPATAREWNGGRAVFREQEAHIPAAAAADPEAFIPQAPIRGHLTAFLTSQEMVNAIRRAGRRLGLEINRRPATEIPNPAALRGELVVIEVPIGEEKRFDWAKRIKQHHAEIPVALLLHEPSRARVIKGLLAKVDTMIGCPVKDGELHEKLEPLIPAAPLRDHQPGTESGLKSI